MKEVCFQRLPFVNDSYEVSVDLSSMLGKDVMS